MMNTLTKLSLIIAGLMISINVLAQSDQPMVGTWKEASTQTTLVLAADRTGTFSTENRSWTFQGSYLCWGTAPLYYLNYTIQVSGQPVSCYAIIKQLSDSTIRFISFLSEDMRASATEETIDSGVLLTKQTL